MGFKKAPRSISMDKEDLAFSAYLGIFKNNNNRVRFAIKALTHVDNPYNKGYQAKIRLIL